MGFLLLLKTKILSFIIRNINGDVSDNTSKFYQINKIWRNIKLDQIPGDYIEFGQLGAYGLTFRTNFNGFYSNEIFEVSDKPIMSIHEESKDKVDSLVA